MKWLIRDTSYKYLGPEGIWGPKADAVGYTDEQRDAMTLGRGQLWILAQREKSSSRPRLVKCRFEVSHGTEYYGHYETSSYREIFDIIREVLRYYRYPASSIEHIGLRDIVASWVRVGMDGVDFRVKGIRLRGLTLEQFNDLSRGVAA